VLNIFVHWSREKEEREGKGERREEEKGRSIRKRDKERKKSIVIQLILNVFL